MCITAVCVIALPDGDTRTLKHLNVFLVTAFFSVLAYIWLLIIVVVWSKDVVTVVEGLITCALLAVLIALAYRADIVSNRVTQPRAPSSPGSLNELVTRSKTGRALTQRDYAAWEDVKRNSTFKDGGNEHELADALRSLYADGEGQKRGRAHYRHGVMASLPGRAYVGTTVPPLRRSQSAQQMKVSSAPASAPAKIAPEGLGVAAGVGGQQQQQGEDSPSKRSKLDRTMTSPELVNVTDGSKKPYMKRSSDQHVPQVPAAGMVRWEQESVKVVESVGSFAMRIERVGGSEGEVTVRYATKDQQARCGRDYESVSGTLTFASGDSGPKEVTLKIIDDDELEKDETFTVVLSEITGGAIFDVDTDGGASEAICTVTICNDDERTTRFAKALKILRMDLDSLHIAEDDWARQISEAVMWPEDTGVVGGVLFMLSLPWRLLFSLVPPPGLGGGWPCFGCALCLIGFQVVLISDFANQMGCHIDLKPGVTAITFVALGTSLPDLFASKQAAIEDKTADNSIGNVTGSNCVNVFFGLGFPWTMSAIAWAIRGADDEWYRRYGHLPHVSSGDFVVQSGNLGFSVMVFVICAILTLSVVLLRRPAELGGGKTGQYLTFAFFVFLWVLYVTMSALAEYGVISTF